MHIKRTIEESANVTFLEDNKHIWLSLVYRILPN